MPNGLDAVIFDLLAVVRGVRLALATVQISFAHNFRRQPKAARDAIEDFFDDEHALRSSESPKGRVRGEVCFGDLAAEFDRGNIVRIIKMKQSAVGHRLGQVQGPTSIRAEMDSRGAQSALLVETNV